jgi:alpha-tubulin suppressor-like RCC1 family protein
MSIRKNTWDLDGHYDLTKSGQNHYLPRPPALFSWGSNSYGGLGQNNLEHHVHHLSKYQEPNGDLLVVLRVKVLEQQLEMMELYGHGELIKVDN